MVASMFMAVNGLNFLYFINYLNQIDFCNSLCAVSFLFVFLGYMTELCLYFLSSLFKDNLVFEN